jgi:hypothetical protein
VVAGQGEWSSFTNTVGMARYPDGSATLSVCYLTVTSVGVRRIAAGWGSPSWLRARSNILFEVNAHDPLIFVGVAGTLRA